MARRVLLLHTGGTLGMTGSPLEPGAFQAQLTQRVPELSRIADLETRIVCNLDSSDVGPAHWGEIARIIAVQRERFDGFVIVHGTDTMAFTASALAFALRGLDRPVVLTGAQRPLAALRTDARRNLEDAVELATTELAEVGICFDGLMLRGTRAVKSDAKSYRAFESPGVEPLARMGVKIDFAAHARRRTGASLALAADFDPRVVVVHVTPGLSGSVVRKLIDTEEVRGVVLVPFGTGTIPTEGSDLGRAFGDAVRAGIDVVAVTRWSGGMDLGAYRNSLALRDAGVLPGGEMRVEAAVPKLMHALARYPHDRAARAAYLQEDVAGELS